MSFLSPWYLLGLLGLGIPLAIHLIHRQKAEKVLFSTIRFLQKAPKRVIFFQQIQQLLLLVLRMAMVALLAVAFARPFITGAFSELVGVAPQSVVLLLDTSMSMRYADYFDRAKEAAIGTIRSLRSGDEAAIITFSDGTGQVKELTTNLADLESFVRNIGSPKYHSTRFIPALRLADQMLSLAHYQTKKVYLISDYQREALDGFDSTWRLSPGVDFEGIRIGDGETTNISVTDVKSPTQLVRDHEEYIILGRVRNLGTRLVSEARVTFGIDERTVTTKTVDLTNKSEAVVEFPITFREGGMHLGAVTVQDDQFTPDNVFFFTINVLPPVKILCINGESTPDRYEDESYWFRLALAQRNQSAFQVDVVKPQQVSPDALDQYEVIALLNVGHLSQEQVRAIKSYVEKGGGLLLAPADRVDASTFNRLMNGLTPAALKNKHSNSKDDYVVIGEVNNRHPIIKPLQTNGGSDFGAARFHGYWSTDPVRGSEVIMRFDSGAAAFLELQVGNGRVLLFTSSMDAEWNNLPLQVLYLPLVHETIHYLTLRKEKKCSYTIGEPVPIRVLTGGVARVIGPNGDETDLASKPGDSGDYVYYKGTRVPGFYSIRTSNLKDHFAVNVSPKESDLSFIPPNEIRDNVINPDTEPQTSLEMRIPMLKARVEKSQRLWWWLLLLVLLLGLGETFLANRTYR